MIVTDSFCLKPFYEEWEILIYLFAIEYSVNHMATEKSHFDFVSNMAIDVFVLVDVLEYV
jgi:hypothetical protein